MLIVGFWVSSYFIDDGRKKWNEKHQNEEEEEKEPISTPPKKPIGFNRDKESDLPEGVYNLNDLPTGAVATIWENKDGSWTGRNKKGSTQIFDTRKQAIEYAAMQ